MSEMIGNRYLQVKKIGDGGMAEVYLALDTVLNREVAVKILRGNLSHDPVALLRFQREANAASGLNHPSIVEVFDVGEDNGRHYIVMEVIRGTTLKTLIHRRGALDKFETVAIMKQLAGALKVAHEKQVIHRDIKPQNILIKDDGTVKLTDFGIALAGDALQLTKHDSVLGSVHYMAPELSRGEGASFQSDIYALGVVFYELLAGDIPYRGDTPVEIAMKHMREPFPSVQKHNPTVPNSIANIIAKATHKNRAERYQSIDDVLIDLESCLDEAKQNETLWVPIQEVKDIEGTKVVDTIDDLKDADIAQRKKRKKAWLLGGFLTVVFLAICGFFVFVGPVREKLVVPKLEGMTVEEAVSSLEKMGLNVNPSYSYKYSDDYDSGIVMDSNPGDGAEVLSGDNIRLTVSHGKTFEIEDYVGKTLESVRTLLSGKSIDIKVVNEPNKDVKNGVILRQEGLMTGDRVAPNQRREIVLYVSASVQLQIPNDIVGKTLGEAQTQLEGLGVKTRTESLSIKNLSASELERLSFGTVVKTDPMPNSYYTQNENHVVTLYYYDEADKPAKPVTPETGEETDTENPSPITPTTPTPTDLA